jgi:hypothetical protein
MKPLETDSNDLRGRRDSWPLHSQGFLYYFCPLNRPRIASELRLRLTPTNDASTFDQGKDLCFTQPNPVGAVGHPWRRPLYSIAKHSGSRPIYERLVEEGLVSPELDKSIQSLPKLTFMYSRCQIVHSIYDTFILDLASDWITLVAITESGIAKIRILRQFRDFRFDKVPYSGTVLARFEPSALPQHADTRTVVLRVVQELTPVRCLRPHYDGYIERPRQDHLFTKQFHGKLRPWSIDIDSPDKGKLLTTGLKLIWDSTPGLKRQPPSSPSEARRKPSLDQSIPIERPLQMFDSIRE